MSGNIDTVSQSSSDNVESSNSPFIDHPWTRAALPFVIGGSSGMVATICIQPIDMVKVRLQLYGEGAKGGRKPTPLSVAREIVSQGKVLDLYTGLSAGLLRQIVYGTGRLGLFGTFIRMMEERAAEEGIRIGFRERTMAGLAAGGLGAMIGNPTEVALIRMQSDGLRPKAQRANYRSAFDALARVARNEGVTALWNGALPTVVRAMATNFGQLTFFSESKSQLQKHTNLSPQAVTITASTVGGFFAAFFSLPFDMVKTRLQRQTRAADGSKVYNGMFDCFVKVAKSEGLFRFYRGFGPYFLRLAPHSIITLVVADNIWALIK